MRYQEKSFSEGVGSLAQAAQRGGVSPIPGSTPGQVRQVLSNLV